MTIKSRWENEIPNCSLQQWIFGSSRDPLEGGKVFIDADRPDTHYLTIAEFRSVAKRIAIGLQAAGLKPGDRVLVYSGNSIWFPAVLVGVLMAGGIFTGANPGFVARELAYQLRDSGASFMFAAPVVLDVALEAAAEANMKPSQIFVFDPEINAKDGEPQYEPDSEGTGARHWAELLKGTLAKAETWDWVEPANPTETTCCLNYSSGTTGVPKGVEISHSAYVANGEGVTFVMNLDPEIAENKKSLTHLCFLPMYHAMAQTYFVANYPRRRDPTYIMPYFDFEKMLQHVQNYRINALVVVPPIVVALAKHPLARQYDLSSVENVGCGAAPLGAEAIKECEALWPARNVKIRQGWGMTEVTCTALGWDPRTEATETTAVGELMPNFYAKLVETDGSDRPITEANKRGELWVSGPTMLKGYWNNPQATSATVVYDKEENRRYLRTGDIAYVERYEAGTAFHVVDRLKELIKVKGNQVAPAELESVLLQRPDIIDVGVVGVTIKGEEYPRAYVVLAPGAKTTGEEIAKWIEPKVTKYKYLKGGVAIVDVIPKNPSGKILRKILREQAKAEVGDKASKL
ncbi:hypothetical protein PspLS_06852 [Pyricularia sp. CBS 133598]|nr:hypothetical protein PspLS_06852 [Pyricularia sp. CBS 133598]